MMDLRNERTGTGEREVVVGVDTHKDFHVAVAPDSGGALLQTRSFAATAAGYQDLIEWVGGFGLLRHAGVEGTGAYGAGLTRALHRVGVAVIEVNRPDRAVRRRRGKTVAIDAEAAARAVLSGSASAVAKSGDGPVEALRVLKLVKDSAVKARVQAINQLHAVLVNAEPVLREPLAALTGAWLLRACIGLDPAAYNGATAVVAYSLLSLARRVRQLDEELRDLHRRLTATVQAIAPNLLELRGVGVDSAATFLIVAGDNPHRLASEGSFAALCGVSPVEASSGKTRRHRLSRGGNRLANAALFRAVLTSLRWDPRTRAYLLRRTTEGLSKREAMRCLKRYLARTV
ncbi:IS110 family transposase [Actinoplanes auranticolor]|uniref:IS110 family transposase n=1 Tax=Actinoplanes auranticolor TaxID=47988 RepID=A0A919SVE3_9ACTN|nr:IS110 family transposase [Actinoplanes auranticolor]GIM79070.1 IS110 family transposase [Actinoplanes auranticolor]